MSSHLGTISGYRVYKPRIWGNSRSMSTMTGTAETLLTPAEVAALFRVDPKTVTRWARAGKLHPVRTLGGHRRYSLAEVHALLS